MGCDGAVVIYVIEPMLKPRRKVIFQIGFWKIPEQFSTMYEYVSVSGAFRAMPKMLFYRYLLGWC
tara:strand:- start:18749 stop:18943 length:195 start_codon:yes stop_codon:yes gene_type:complete